MSVIQLEEKNLNVEQMVHDEIEGGGLPVLRILDTLEQCDCFV